MTTRFRLVQLSDLHFSEGTSKKASHRHSIPHLRGLQVALRNQVFDRALVTGDISNGGDEESLLRAHDWLFKTVSVGGGEEVGLRLPASTSRIIPGNHDAWNRERSSQILGRWQKSLANYNHAFSAHAMRPEEGGAYYDWIGRGRSGLFLAFVDSSYLGDPHLERAGEVPMLFDRVAKGKLSLRQSERLLSWFDQGMAGNLPAVPGGMECIPRSAFASSLKILVMHHYLFEPAGSDDEYFMQITDRKRCFRNVALADFDVLLCGHKHIPDFHGYNYGEKFDSRARARYLLNCFRRSLGIQSLPLQYRDKDGRLLSRWTTALVNLFVTMGIHDDSPSEFISDTVRFLERALDDPEAVARDVRYFLRDHSRTGEEVLTRAERDELRRQIALSLTPQHRARLRPVLEEVKRFVRALEARPFLQIIAGSAAKASAHPDAPRSFNLYEITEDGDGWIWRSERYFWEPDSQGFSTQPEVHLHTFRSDRTLSFH